MELYNPYLTVTHTQNPDPADCIVGLVKDRSQTSNPFWGLSEEKKHMYTYILPSKLHTVRPILTVSTQNLSQVWENRI
jgi:hypothetical protein